MLPFKAYFQIDNLKPYKQPGMLFGGGLLAGLLLFLLWLVFFSSPDKLSQEPAPASAATATNNPRSDEAGVLGGVNAATQSGPTSAVSDLTGNADGAAADRGGSSEAAGASAAAADPATQTATGTVSDGEAIANGLLGPPASANPEPPTEPPPENAVKEPGTEH